MANSYGISERDEQRIRARDKRCVYCGAKFRKSPRRYWPTIEHFNNDGPFDEYFNIGLCCWGCNSSKRRQSLSAWLDSDYCRRKKITCRSVANAVRQYLHRIKGRPNKDAAMIRVYDEAGNVIQTHEHRRDFKEVGRSKKRCEYCVKSAIL